MIDCWRHRDTAPTEDGAEADLWVQLIAEYQAEPQSYRVPDCQIVDGNWCAFGQDEWQRIEREWAYPKGRGSLVITHWRNKPAPPITPSGA